MKINTKFRNGKPRRPTGLPTNRPPSRPTGCFADPALLLDKDRHPLDWPCGEDDAPLFFAPHIILQAYPHDAAWHSKHSLATGFIEYARSLHLDYVNNRNDHEHAIDNLRAYAKSIFAITNGDESHLRWVAESAGLAGPTSYRLVDYALDGIGSWRA